MSFLFLPLRGGHFRCVSILTGQIFINLHQHRRFLSKWRECGFGSFSLALHQNFSSLLDVPSVVTVVLPVFPFLEASTGSDPMLLGGCIFLLGSAGFGREGH
jgi:hypothetical protein